AANRDDAERRLGEWLRAGGHPFGWFLDRWVRGEAPIDVRRRVHDTVFADWAPGAVGAAWQGGFVRYPALRSSPWTESTVAERLGPLLAHPALWLIEGLRVDGRAWSGPVTWSGYSESSGHWEHRDEMLEGEPLAPVAAALAPLGLPALRSIELLHQKEE